IEAIAAARTPVSAAQMVPVLFRRPLDLQQRFFAMGEAIAHLNYLWRRGRVRRTLADDGTLPFAPSFPARLKRRDSRCPHRTPKRTNLRSIPSRSPNRWPPPPKKA